MKKVIGAILAAMALLLGSALPGHAWGGHGGHHGYGGHYGFGYGHHGHGGYYGHGYGYPYYSYSAPVVIQQPPQVYVQQEPQPYWYYCENSKAYYPYVQRCPNGWIKVVPPTSAPGQ